MSHRVLLKQGAEAKVYLVDFLDKQAILKERFRKTYRHPVLDEKITAKRITSEARILAKAYKCSIPVPLLLHVSLDTRQIYMEYVAGESLKDFVLGNPSEQLLHSVFRNFGEILAKMHCNSIIHGDLTTSNVLVCRGSEKLVVIDFGLAFVSCMQEDKAVDLYVLERAIQSSHSQFPFLFDSVLEGYVSGENALAAESVLGKLEEVRLRGRKKSMIG